MSEIEKKTEELVTKTINNLGYDIYDIEYTKEGKDYFLRIYIDSKNGINLDDCEKVSNEVTKLLDEKDYIKDKYFLEISSPGIEKILRKEKHFKDNINKEVQIKLFKPINDIKGYKGVLKNFDDNYITILINNKEIKINRNNISQVKTVYSW